MNSVFTKIIDGDLPARFVYRDDTVVAFLSIEPLAYGHVLVVPTAQVDKWTDLNQQQWNELTRVAQRIGQAIVTGFDAQRCGFIIAGFDVPHTHIHLFPTDRMSDYNFSQAIAADATDPEKMDAAAQKIRDVLGTDAEGRMG